MIRLSMHPDDHPGKVRGAFDQGKNGRTTAKESGGLTPSFFSKAIWDRT